MKLTARTVFYSHGTLRRDSANIFFAYGPDFEAESESYIGLDIRSFISGEFLGMTHSLPQLSTANQPFNLLVSPS